jgi:hypothetical protein
MNKIELVPLLEASIFPGEVEDELARHEVNTHYQADILYVNWNNPDIYVNTKQWLVEYYGEDIKQYKFLIKIGYWIAGTLGTISFISLSIYSHLSGKSFTQFILEVIQMLPWNQ